MQRRFFRLWFAAVWIALLLAANTHARETLHIRFPTASSDDVYRQHGLYHKALLELLLKKSGRPYTITPVLVPALPASRVARYLDTGLFNVVTLHTDMNKEKELRAIHYPIYRGLSGWRLFFIQKNAQSRFNQVHSLDDLRKLVAGMGYDWPDTTIMANSGFQLLTAPRRSNLLRMLNHGRIDYFPRGAFEIWAEQPEAQQQSVVIEQQLALHYPTACYIFVSRDDKELAQVLEKAFTAAVDDGSFNTLFYQHFGKGLHKARFHERRIMHIPNTQLPKEAMLDDPRVWFSPSELATEKAAK